MSGPRWSNASMLISLVITAPEYLQIVATLLNKGKGPNGVVILRPETISTM